MDKHRLRTPELAVLMHDGAEYTVQCFNVDLVAWERERARRNWPAAQDAPFTWMTFLAWHALCKRPDHELPDQTLDAFTNAMRQVVSEDQDGAGDDELEGAGVDPMSRGAGDDSS